MTNEMYQYLADCYEGFLAAHNPALRKKRGVWYTPQPIVNFIVRSVDEILQTDFELAEGLAEKHRVQILDPATGTGNFLAETVSQIYEKFQRQHDIWQSYVQEHLIPRLYGFEIMKTPHDMAHVGLARLLERTGYVPGGDQRFHIYLTNALQEHPIKRDAAVMVVIGNPPYNVSTQNKTEWIGGLLADYKTGLNERNIQPLSDDYIKFIRLGQHYIERNGAGILAYISNNSFIDGLIHRQMRKRLLEVFDKIYILDLHGSARRKETAPDGDKDENVFDIQQGVSINIFIKTGHKKTGELAKVFHCDLYGKRSEKFVFLRNHRLQTIKWQKLTFSDANYFFVPKDFNQKNEYEKGFKIDELFPVNTTGVKTHDDANLVSFVPFTENNQRYAYRHLDVHYINYDLKKVQRHRNEVMKHFLAGENVGLLTCRQQTMFDFHHVLVSKEIADIGVLSTRPSESAYVFPLYLYNASRVPNLDMRIVEKIAQSLCLKFVSEKTGSKKNFAPIDILNYIYAVLYCPTYRERYRAFLKIDFPRVPYPDNVERFWQLVKLGEKLRRLHLMEGVEPQPGMANFPIAGTNEIERVQYVDSKVFINDTQHFDNVPSDVWDFFIGGYQPAQKWLKDRKDRTLNFDDIRHYQKIVAVLQETIDVMGEINEAMT
jgi:predicted helicase